MCISSKIENPETTANLIYRVMERFKVDEKTATAYVNFMVTEASEMMQKWIANQNALQKKHMKEQAEEIYGLIKKWKVKNRAHRDAKSILDEIERKILKLCVG